MSDGATGFQGAAAGSVAVAGCAGLLALSTFVVSGCAAGQVRPSARSLFGTKRAPWTIQCIELTGPERKRRVAQLADTLKRTPGIRPGDVFVFSDGARSGLYYGRYRRTTDPKSGRRTMPRQMRRDLDLIKQLGDEMGRRYFLTALAARVPTPDVGNPAWDLKRVSGSYSLQVAVFEPTDQFWEYKQAGADYCAFLRKEGFEAYYHHSDASSIVTVGVFGPEAFSVVPQGNRYLHRYSDDVAKLQENELLKFNYVNGGIVYVVGPDGSRAAVPSFLVEIPRAGDPR